jgi:hypothetical protein
LFFFFARIYCWRFLVYWDRHDWFFSNSHVFIYFFVEIVLSWTYVFVTFFLLCSTVWSPVLWYLQCCSFCYLGSFMFPYMNCTMNFSISVNNDIGILMSIALNL